MHRCHFHLLPAIFLPRPFARGTTLAFSPRARQTRWNVCSVPAAPSFHGTPLTPASTGVAHSAPVCGTSMPTLGHAPQHSPPKAASSASSLQPLLPAIRPRARLARMPFHPGTKPAAGSFRSVSAICMDFVITGASARLISMPIRLPP